MAQSRAPAAPGSTRAAQTTDSSMQSSGGSGQGGGGGEARVAVAADPSFEPTPASAASSVLLGNQRQNGFERPFSRDQVVSWLGHSLSALSFYVAAAGVYLCTGQSGVEEDNKNNSSLTTLTLGMLSVHVAVVIVMLTAWRSCESIDPARHVEETLPNGWLGIKLSGPRWEKTRYCALCRKAVPGLDHHCTWLQTCIGKANYVQFFTVACTGAMQFVLQVVYAALCLFWLQSHPLEDAGAFGYVVEACLIACLAISVPCTIMYFVLLGFHLWLMALGYGTYEWMLRRRKEQRAKMEAKKHKETRSSTDANDASASSTRGSQDGATEATASAATDKNAFVRVDGSAAPATPGGSRELTSL